MKKLLLSLGALTAVIAPVAAVVACGTETKAPQGPSVEEQVQADLAAKLTPRTVSQVKSSLLTGDIKAEAAKAAAEQHTKSEALTADMKIKIDSFKSQALMYMAMGDITTLNKMTTATEFNAFVKSHSYYH